MTDIQITWQTILALLGGLIIVIDFAKRIRSIGLPFTELKDKHEDLEDRVDKLEGALSRMIEYQEQSSSTIGLAVAELLNHTITGNDIEKLKQREDELNTFFYRGEHIESK